ncbi:hypothetical protein Daus18300_014441 [Diaporthe australafricana]|uniref:AAA+ ATPase domain-containing protein n=1 Tax=Diaporthe australafricana TaxID=127596 RepID=A0ABR3VVA6_9PEZI
MSPPMNESSASQPATRAGEEPTTPKIHASEKTIPESTCQPIPTKHLGIKIRKQPDNEDDIDIDILAVPGIGTDPETTWSYFERDPQDKSKIITDVNWLSHSTMLPSKFPNARIMTFGYDSRWFGDAPAKQRLSGIAIKVLAELTRIRKDCDRRPILFIGHCYGGLVMQQVYLQSQRLPSDYPGIYDSITGMIFLGTPHYGSDISGMATGTVASLADIYETIRKQSLQIDDSLLRTVDHDNTVLVDTVADFTREIKLRVAGPEIFCFFEERPTAIGRIVSLKDRAKVFMVSESSGTLPGYRKLGLTTDHFNINKFESHEDSHYISVAEELEKMKHESEVLMKQRRAAAHGNVSGISTQQISSEAHTSIPMLPFPVARGFASRNGILEKVQSHFENSTKVVLVGACGSGKTHVAVEYAADFRKDNPDAQIYCVNASNAADFELSYHCINDKLKLKPVKKVGVMKAVRDYLNEEAGQWLMIVDGLDQHKSTNEARSQTGAIGLDSDSLQSILDYMPDGNPHGSQILITTRSKRVATQAVSPKYIVELPKRLTEDDALKLLLDGSKTRVSSSPTYQLRIVDALQSSAGALALVRAYKRNYGSEFSWRGLSNSLQPSATGSTELPSQADERIRSAISIWNPLYQHLKNNHEEAADLLHVLCRLDVQGMPAVLLDYHCDEKSQRDENKKALRSYDMLEISVNKKEVRVTPMIRLLANSMVSEGSEDVTCLDETALGLVGDAFPSAQAEDNISNWRRRALKPCALAALRLRLEPGTARYPRAKLLLKLGAYESRLGNQARAVNLLEESLKLYKNGGKKSEEAKKLEKQVKKLLESTKKDRPKSSKRQPMEKDGSTSTSNLIELPGTKAVPISPESKADEVRSMSHVVLGSHRREGCMEENIKHHKQILAWYQANLGAQHKDTMRQQFNLALELDANGEHTEAEKMYREAIGAMEGIYGRDSSNSDLWRMQNGLARKYAEHRRFEEADALWSKVLEGQTKSLGADHPDALVTRMNIALVAQELRPGDLETPAADLQSVLATQKRLLGPAHPATLRTACNLAQIYRLRGRIQDAEPLFTLCLEGQIMSLGENHPDTMRTLAMRKELESITEVY